MKETFSNISFDNIDTPEVLKITSQYFQGNKNHLLFFVNAHCYNIAQKNKEYLSALNAADLTLNDGIGIKIACKIFGVTVKENMNGTDLIPKILEQSAQLKKRVFLLGSKPGIAAKAKKNLEEKINGINIVGIQHGFFKDNVQEVIDQINKAHVDLLVVGMGVPMQELFLLQNHKKLNNVKLCVAGGAIIDFQSGIITRAPNWARRYNIEWLHRFFLEPRRMFNRYFTGGILFFTRVIIARLRKRKA